MASNKRSRATATKRLIYKFAHDVFNDVTQVYSHAQIRAIRS